MTLALTHLAPRPATEPLSALRNTRVAADGRRVALGVGVSLVVALGVTAVMLFLSGLHTNAQIDRLHQGGVPVEVTVTGCIGELGGSGSNAAGYTCRGSFTLGGGRYTETLPGNERLDPGTLVSAVAVPGDPALVTPTAILAGEHPSSRLFIVPAALTALAVVGAAYMAVAVRRRPQKEVTARV